MKLLSLWPKPGYTYSRVWCMYIETDETYAQRIKNGVR